MTRRLKPNGFFRRGGRGGGGAEVPQDVGSLLSLFFIRGLLSELLPREVFRCLRRGQHPSRTPAYGSRRTRGDVSVSLTAGPDGNKLPWCAVAATCAFRARINGLGCCCAAPPKPGCCVLWDTLGLP